MITTPNTFVATANAGLYLGAKVNFCDVENKPETLMHLNWKSVKILS